MHKFAANISTMFSEPNALARIRRASALGFKWVEWLFPYQYSKTEIQNVLVESGLDLVLINTALGDRTLGERGIGAVPSRAAVFRREFEQTLGYAEFLGIPHIHVMAGVVPPDQDRSRYLDMFIRNLDWATNQINPDTTSLLIEPLNRVDTPNYLHATCEESLEVIGALSGKVGLQFDFYHLQIMEGNLGANLERYFEHIKHVQFSSVPGRHEPQFGEVNCVFLFNRLAELGYAGYLGCEYSPKEDVEKGLSWMRPYS